MTTIADKGYLPLRDYALIGDCHGAALVSRNGSVDWCCFGRFDAEPVYGEMLNQAFLYKILDGPLEPEERKLFSELADYVAAHWQEPGHSIW